MQFQARPEDVKTKSFELTFPLDEKGNVTFLDLWIEIETNDFNLPEKRKKTRIQPSKDSEYCIFLLTPRKKGNLRLLIQVYLAETLLASGFMKINGYTKFDEGFQVIKTLITLPLGAFAIRKDKKSKGEQHIIKDVSGSIQISKNVVVSESIQVDDHRNVSGSIQVDRHNTIIDQSVSNVSARRDVMIATGNVSITPINKTKMFVEMIPFWAWILILLTILSGVLGIWIYRYM